MAFTMQVPHIQKNSKATNLQKHPLCEKDTCLSQYKKKPIVLCENFSDVLLFPYLLLAFFLYLLLKKQTIDKNGV